MYKVIKYFVDLQDKNHPYNVGDVFPRPGMEVKAERFAELAGNQNRQHVPLIQLVEEAPVVEVEPEAEEAPKPKRARKPADK